jgi:hypothetical protein
MLFPLRGFELQFKQKHAAMPQRSRRNMATSTVDVTTEAGALSTEKVTYRKYVKLDTDKEGKTIVSDQRILAEADSKDKKTGLAVNWQKAEDDGFLLFAQNDVTTYNVKTREGFELLVPDEEIRMYVINTGLSTIQTARANAFMKAMKEGAAEPEPEYNDATLDLRVGVGEDGEYSINKTPSRRSLSDIEKLIKTLTSLGMTPEQQKVVLMSYGAALTQVSAATEEAAA